MAMRQSSAAHPQSARKGETAFFAYVPHRQEVGVGAIGGNGDENGTGMDIGGVGTVAATGGAGGASGGGAYTAGGVLSSAWLGLLQYPHSIHLSLKLDDKETRASSRARARERERLSQGAGGEVMVVDQGVGVGTVVGAMTPTVPPRRRKLSLQAQALYEIQHTLSSADLLAARAMKRLSEARGCVDSGPGASGGSALALVPAPRLVDRLATQVTPLTLSLIYTTPHKYTL